jgi:prepilin-type N-terminal cleavage/methylation domain-containing protein
MALHKQQGFTLIEFVMVILLISIIAIVGSQMLAQGLKSSLTLQDITNASWQGQLAIERMMREIRYVRSAVDILIRTNGQFSFVDMNGNTIDYKLIGTNLMRNAQILASGVNTLTFTYMDKNGNTVANTTDVHYVGITMNITLNNTQYTLTSSAFLGDLSS